MIRKGGILVVVAAAVFVFTACSEKYSAEHDGKKLGEAVCDLRDADSQDEVDDARSDIDEQIDDLASKYALYTAEDRNDVQNNLADLAEHAIQGNDLLLQQDLAVLERSIENIAEDSNEVSEAAWDGVREGLSDCTQSHVPPTKPWRQSMPRLLRLAAAGLALSVVLAACGGDDDDDDATTDTTTTEAAEPTTTTVVEETTTTAPVEATVSYDFASETDATGAEQAATTMTRRIEKFGYPGSVAVVNADGTGLEITVVGVSTQDEATEIVDVLNFRGVVYYRPVLAGPLPPTAGETASSKTMEQLGLPPDTDVTTVQGYDIPTTGVNEMTPDVEAVIPDYEFGTTNVIVRWQVGPSQLDGTSTENTQVTTLGGNDAVKIVLADTDSGLGAFNALTQSCFDKAATCPTGIYAVQFDGVIAFASVPRPDETTFTPFTQNDVIVSSSTWTEDEALVLAIALEAGALPVDLVPA